MREAACTSPAVFQPKRCSFCAVFCPTPGIFSIGKPCRKAAILGGGSTNCPFGLRQSEATFARNLFGAMPADAVSPVCWKICARIWLATSVAYGTDNLLCDTSR